MPDYNPYTIKRCNDCDIAKGGSVKLGTFIPDNEVCASCKCIRSCLDTKGFKLDKVYGNRLKISEQADPTEVEENIRAARTLLKAFPDMNIQIRKHVFEEGVKNPEYLINDALGDRKGIESENGIANGFNKAIKQGCSVVVIDLDMHPEKFPYLRVNKLAQGINNRHMDFKKGVIEECYVIYDDKTIRVGKEFFSDDVRRTKEQIRLELEKIKGDRSHP